MGWKGESRRHSLSRKGIKTNIDKTKRLSVRNFVARGKKQRFLKNSRDKRVYTGKVAEQIIFDLLDMEYPEWKKHYLDNSGYFKEDNMWTAWDNSFGELAVENFYMKENARLFATELNLTHTEIHQKDIQDAFKSILEPIRENERFMLRGTTSITDGIENDIVEYSTRKKQLAEITSSSMEEIAIILKGSKEEEKDFLRGDNFVTKQAIDDFAKFFNEHNPKTFERSHYWDIINAGDE